MAQNRATGKKAADYGLIGAALVGKQLGAIKVSSKANEFELDGERITIRMAHLGNNQVGVLYEMLDRIKAVIGAFEISQDEYELRSISPTTFKKHMRDSKTGDGRVGLVRKKIFMERGDFVKRITLTPGVEPNSAD